MPPSYITPTPIMPLLPITQKKFSTIMSGSVTLHRPYRPRDVSGRRPSPTIAILQLAACSIRQCLQQKNIIDDAMVYPIKQM